MFCNHCGQKLQDGAKFCNGCGTPVSETDADAGAAGEGHGAPVEKPSARKGQGGKLPVKALIIAAAVVVVVLLAVVLVVNGVFGTPKTKAGAALLKSVEAYSDAYEKAGLPNTTELLKSQKHSQSVAVTLTDVGSGFGYLSALEGFGLRADLDTNISGKEMALSATAYYGATDLISGQAVFENSKVYASVPQLVGEGKFYGVDTTTLGADLVNWGADDEVEDLSFNVFELAQILTDGLQMSKEAEKALEDGKAALIKAITVEKTGKEDIDVNGNRTSCTAYQVVIPQDALEDFLDVLADVASDTDYETLMLELLQALGISENDAEDLVDEMDFSMDGMDDMQNELEEILDLLEDIELVLYVKGGYAMAVEYENKIDDVKVSIGAYMGGGKTLADDFSVTVEARDDYGKYTLELVSTGDHTGSSGTFTDETTIKGKEDGETMFHLVSEVSFKAKGEADNFSWSLSEKMSGLKLEAEGQLTASDSKMSLALEELSIAVEGMEVGAVELSYAIDSYDMGVNVKEPVMLSTFDEDDLIDLAEEIADNAEDWGSDVVELLEDELTDAVLEELLWMFGDML